MRCRHLLWNHLPNTVLALTSVAAFGLVSENEERPHLGRFDNVQLVEFMTPEERAMVDWATGRFAQAGLKLPELTVRFDPTRELCNFHQGRYHHDENGERIVTICTRDSETFGAQLDRRRTLLHEFGHAWDFANLTDDDRDELGRILGSDAWNDAEDGWAERGVERFAETFVFALLDQPLRQLKVDLECSDLLDAFRTATGAEPLGPGLPPCAGSASSRQSQGLGGFAAPAAESESVVFIDTPAEVVELAEWALDLFHQAEMDLPNVEFHYHGDDTGGCNGHEGLHRPRNDVSIVEICTTVVGYSTQVMLLHELSHAWSEHSATDEQLAAFQELRGYAHWLNYDEALWHENGTEQAAEILVWGLVDRPMAMSRITDNGCDDLLAGYVALTGDQPLHGFTDLCAD